MAQSNHTKEKISQKQKIGRTASAGEITFSVKYPALMKRFKTALKKTGIKKDEFLRLALRHWLNDLEQPTNPLRFLPDDIQRRLAYTAQREGVSERAVICKCLNDGLHQVA